MKTIPKKNIFKLSLCCVALVILVTLLSYSLFIKLPPTHSDKNFYINDGESLTNVLIRLTDQTSTKKLLFNIFLKINAIDSFQAGEYELFNNLQENFIAFSKGDTKNNIFIIKEGTNLYELQNQIEESGLINDCHLLKCINSEFTHKEGILFPNTYFYKWNMKASSLLNKSHNTQISILDNLWMNKNSNNPLKTKYEALILASIIEKEAGNNKEKPQIASVFLKRIKLGMRLQADPTIIYGLLPNFDGDIKKSDILDKENLYNTYMISGLPPSPISVPSLTSIEAAINSAPGDYLFFVADTKYSHHFSKTYKEHVSKIEELGLNK